MIVSVTRGDLRGEFAMADEAFALSPISARAARPSEEDYEAISQAFMETSRGRWFLGEYARRNRNTDTTMVLDAVARIEQNLAAQRDHVSDSGLAEALAAIRSAVDHARASAAAALDDLALEAALTPVRKGARVIREISWRLREIGSDGRICDLIDSQLTAIETGCGELLSAGTQTALSAAFDLIEQRIASLGDADTATSPTPEATTPAVQDQAPVETAAAADAVAATVQADNADDEAVLDLIAMEMMAPDVSEPDPEEVQAAVMIAAGAEPPEIEPVMARAPPAPAEPPPRPSRPAPEPSLGSSLIASGIVRRPGTSNSDPLAPIRRMSQAEKIAFFS